MKAYVTISHGSAPLGTLRLTLRPDIVPRTVENFTHFLNAKKNGESSAGYRDSSFHRIIPKFMAQGGDFIRGDGTGSATIHGRTSFPDENFLLSHSQRGTLSMANSGPDTNGCQFFITFRATAHLDGKHVVFGYVDWREDDESAAVMEKLEGVRTDRRSDRPLERVTIVDCGVIDEGRGGAAGRAGDGGEGKLAGEAKKNKLLRAYGDVDPAEGGADEDEIDLDAEDDGSDAGPDGEGRDAAPSPKASADAGGDADETDIEDENEEPMAEGGGKEPEGNSEPPPATGKLSKKAALQKRLAALRTKINQGRTLNRREVHAEAARMGSEEASRKERKRQNKQDRTARKEEYDAYVAGKLNDHDESRPRAKGERKKLGSMSQPAYDSARRMNLRAEREERSLHGPDDYYNPEGQYNNYERNLNAVKHKAPRGGEGDAALGAYDPSLAMDPNNPVGERSAAAEREGAHRLADEMRRRAEKKLNKKRRIEFDAADISSINERNKRFNQKIGRNFDKHTAEIRQNLERGTAL